MTNLVLTVTFIILGNFLLNRMFGTKIGDVNLLLDAMRRETDLFLAIYEWRELNPELYLGDVEYARGLVFGCIEAHLELSIIRGTRPNESLLKILYQLLDEHGPEPPRKVLRISWQPVFTRAVLFMII